MTTKNNKFIYILFADIKGYSANKKNLDLLAEIEDLLYGFGEKYFGDTQKNCFKVLGDGMLATSYDVKTITENALAIVNHFKDKEKKGEFDKFTEKPKIRIALHLGKKGTITERRLQENTFKDIAGNPVIETARIEPIVMPNEVFCSKDFVDALEYNPVGNVQTTELGNFELGKAHDSFKMDLYVLHNQNETKDIESLKKHINDKLSDKNKTYDKEATDLCKMSFLERGSPTFVQNANINTNGNDIDIVTNVQGNNTININRNK